MTGKGPGALGGQRPPGAEGGPPGAAPRLLSGLHTSDLAFFNREVKLQ